MTFCPFGIDTQLIQSIAKLMLIGADMEPKVLSMLADVSIMKGENIEATKETFAEAMALIAKLPLEFKQLGFATHADFDQIAQDAIDLGDPKHTLDQLGSTLGRCVACHSTYRLKETSRVE